MYVTRGHGGDGGGDDRPLPRQILSSYRVRGTRKPNRGCRKAGRLDTREQTKNLRLRKITDQWGPQKIRFEFNDRATLMPHDDHAAHWSNLLGEIVREFLMHYPSWHKIEPKREAGVIGNIRSQFDLTFHMQSPFWPKISKGIEHHLDKIYIDNNSTFKQEHWVLKLDGTRDVEGIRSRCPVNITLTDWDKHIAFWLDPKNAA
ncbi:hypothetical protein Tco_0843972 [Tanacetum coccineum]